MARVRLALDTSLHLLLWLSLLCRVCCNCPAPCQCQTPPTGSGQRVLCPPGQTALPAGLTPNTTALVISGRPSQHGSSVIAVLRHSDLTSLPNLEELVLPFVNLTTLEDNVFSSLANLKRLSLHSNKLDKLTSLTFSGLTNLDFLDLTDNVGCVVQSDATFTPLTSLKTLYLGGLGLKEAKSEWFRSLSLLEDLDLHGNAIEFLEPDFLQGLANMKVLELTGNRLPTLSPTLQQRLASVPTVYLDSNPWHCNCAVTGFKQLATPQRSGGTAVCLTPQRLVFRQIATIPDAQLICTHPKIISCGGPYDVNAGSQVTLECVVEGDPFPTLQWSSPDGRLLDTAAPFPASLPLTHRTVNTTVTVADFAMHQGQWTVTAANSMGTDRADIKVNVFTTTLTSTTLTSTPATTSSKQTTGTPISVQARPMDNQPGSSLPSVFERSEIWFFVAMAAFGLSLLVLTSVVLVIVVKRKTPRQVGAERGRRTSILSLGSQPEIDVTVLSRASAGQRARVM